MCGVGKVIGAYRLFPAMRSLQTDAALMIFEVMQKQNAQTLWSHLATSTTKTFSGTQKSF